jgi:hypothetical protein
VAGNGWLVEANVGKDNKVRTLSKYPEIRPDTMFQCIVTTVKPSCDTLIHRILCLDFDLRNKANQ